MKGLVEPRHHFENDILMIVILDSREIEVGRKSSLMAKEHFPKARTALEAQPVQNAALG